MKWVRNHGGVIAYYLLAEGICMGVGALYHLTLPWQLVLGGILLFFLPKWRRNYADGKVQQQRLSDAQIYMEQLIYAFGRQEKLLTAIADVLVLFPNGNMHDVLDQAVKLIRYDYQEEDTTKQALRLIEREYQNKRLATIHRFLYKVECIGGSFEGITTLLLRDLNEWRRSMDNYQKACKRERRNVGVAITTVLCICMVTNYLLPAQADITGNVVQMASSVVLILVLLVIYTKADGKLSVNWLTWGDGENSSKLAKQYERYISFDEKTEQRKSCFMAVVPLLGCLLFLIISNYFPAVLCMILSVFLFYQHRIGHSLAQRNLAREIEKAFPHWLMELSLLLQIDNVQVAIAKSVSEAPEVLKPALEKFLQEMLKQPESAEPYLHFLEEFSNPQIQSAMKMLYAMSMGNSGSEREQLEELIARNQNLMSQSEALQQEDSLAGMYLLFLTPTLAGGMKLLVDMTIFLFAFFAQSMVG